MTHRHGSTVSDSGTRGIGKITARVVRLLVSGVLVIAAMALTVPTTAWADPAPPTYDGSVPLDVPKASEVFSGFTLGTIRDGRAATTEENFVGLLADDPFYAEPPIPAGAAPGTLLKAKRFDVLFTGYRPGNIAAWKIMYVTEDVRGRKVISTGVVMIPEDGRPNSTRSVVAYQEANDSVGPKCHPSTQWSGGAYGDASAWSALGPLALMWNRGLAVVISDIGNDADPKPHGVFAGRYAGMALLNGLRAAYHVGAAGLNPAKPVGIFGVAGGGVGGAFAAEYANHYAPEINLKATMVEALAADQKNFITFADGALGSGFVMATLLGLEAQYPEMRMNSHLNPAGRALADYYRASCQTYAYFMAPFLPMRLLFNGNRSPADIPAFQRVYAQNNLGYGDAPRGKMLVTSCASDDSFMVVTPASDSKKLVSRYAAQGADAQYYGLQCGIDTFITDMYKWGTELFGMHTVDWLATELNS
ncbi:lipase family protein [Gordonia sp. VNK1]|uniref:lipase family protein n=1 Tax=Gordonia oleivorans TaxID=3156618 RepID=UPI0032B3837B